MLNNRIIQLPEGKEEVHSIFFKEVVQTAADVLKRGGVIVYPTDTVYGIGVDVAQVSAMKRLFEIKKRDTLKPVSLMVTGIVMVEEYVESIPLYSAKVLNAYWPGPLTAVFRAKKDINPLLTREGDTIGFRVPDNAFCLELIRLYNNPITSTSANLSGEKECTSIEQLVSEVKDAVDLIIDGGEITGGVPSTVVFFDYESPKLLREGAIPKIEIERLLGIRIE